MTDTIEPLVKPYGHKLEGMLGKYRVIRRFVNVTYSEVTLPSVAPGTYVIKDVIWHGHGCTSGTWIWKVVPKVVKVRGSAPFALIGSV